MKVKFIFVQKLSDSWTPIIFTHTFSFFYCYIYSIYILSNSNPIMLYLIVLFSLLSCAFAFRTGFPHTVAFSTLTSRRNLFGTSEPPKEDKKKGGGMFGGIGDMMGNMKKMAEVTKSAQILQKELSETVVVCTDDNNLVVANYSCDGKPISVNISEEGLTKSKEELSAAVTMAVKAAAKKGMDLAKSRTDELFKQYGIPVPAGLF